MAWLVVLLLVPVLLVFLSVMLLSLAFSPFSLSALVGGLACLAASVALTATAIRAQGGRRAALRFTGTHFESSLHGRVPWAGIQGIDLAWRYSRPGSVPVLMLCLEPGVVMEDRWPLAIRIPGPELGISLRMHGDAERVFEAALRFRDQVDPPRLEHWRSGMTAEAAAVLGRQQALVRKSEELAGRFRGEDPREQAEIHAERGRQVALASSRQQKRELLLVRAGLFAGFMAILALAYVWSRVAG